MLALYEKAQTPRKWHAELFDWAGKVGITCFSSVFSRDGVDFLEAFDPPAYKIASAEIRDTGLIAAAYATGKPLIVSTGMANLEDIERLPPEVLLLHCVAKYPSTMEDANLNALKTLRICRGIAGLSDHTPGYETAIAATALGAVAIEKHFKIDDDCIDAAYSLNSDDFARMCVAVRGIWAGMGNGLIRPTCKPRKK